MTHTIISISSYSSSKGGTFDWEGVGGGATFAWGGGGNPRFPTPYKKPCFRGGGGLALPRKLIIAAKNT